MKRMLAGLALVFGTAALSGCYYDPGYSYVRGNGYQGDAYYGEGPSVIYRDDYYASGYYGPSYYGPSYYGYGGYAPGVSVGISGTWRDDSHRRGRDRDWRGDWHGQRAERGHDERRGDWRGQRDQGQRDYGQGGHREQGHDRGDWRNHGGRDRDHH